jgi:hypothetical protein
LTHDNATANFAGSIRNGGRAMSRFDQGHRSSGSSWISRKSL